jgi:ABC-2 type transport system permease protein
VIPRLGLYWSRTVFEVRLLARDRRSVMFSVLLPIFLLVIFGSVFTSATIGRTGVRFTQYLVAGLLASGLLYSSFQQLAIAIPEERVNGTLKRLVGSPIPRSVYFVGKFATSLFIYVFQCVFLIGIGHYAYHIALPADASKWFAFVWISLLGLVVSTLLGVAFSSFAKDGKSASALAAPLVIFFQFTSGVYFVYTDLPQWMQRVSAFFPLKWMAQAMRGVFLPAAFGRREAAGCFEFGRSALVLGAWALAGALLCRYTFRWLPKGED